MLTKKNRALFRVLPAIMGAALLAGCKPPGPKALLDGQRLLERGQVPKAIERLRVATDLLGTNAVAWNYLGIAYHQDGQVSNAVTAYKRALAANPDLTETRMNLGMLWLEQGRGGEAKSEFTAYTLRRPNAPEGFLKLAAAELRLREFGLAELHARRAVQLNDANPEGWNTLGLIQLQQRRTRDAAQSFGAALRQRPDYAPALLNLAIVSQQQFGDRATAIKLYRQYIETKPRPADADRVVQIIRQLESELAPVRPSATVPSPPTTQTVQVAAKPVVTNSPAMRSVPVSTAVPVSKPEPVAPKPVVVNPVPSRPAPKVVELPPEPEIRTLPVAEAPKSVVVSAPAVRSAAAPSSTSTAPAPTDAVADSAEPKRTFLQSINPINLFRRDAKPAQPTPLPPTTEAGAESDPGPTREVAGAPTAPATIASSTPSRSVSQLTASNLSQFPRYQYRGGGNLTPGDRSTAQRYADRGVRALASKSFAEARIAFAAAVQADPSWFQAQFNYAACALESRRIQESLGAGEAALALEPKSVDARYNFALALKEGNYVVDAALELERVLTANPTDARAHLTLGNLYAEDLRRPDLARSHYLKVLELEPRHPRRDVIRHWLAANPGH